MNFNNAPTMTSALLPKPSTPAKLDLREVEAQEQTQFGIESGIRRLATAVLNKAVEDLRPQSGPRAIQEAKEFLCQPNKDLTFWCDLAGLNAPAVVDASLRLLTKG